MTAGSGAAPAQTFLDPQAIVAFSEDARRAVYEVIALRRDVRHFRPEVEVEPAVLERILGAAHLAPSVGFSQPWGFVVVRERARRERIRESFLRCREAEGARFPPARREAYLAHKLEGLLEAPLNVCVAVDLRSRGDAILGTTAQPEAVRASACCAVQNLWLAARAEGLGVGWVSIVEPAVLRAELALPPGVEPIAYLCVGHPVAFRERPMLEETGWLPRRPLAEVLHLDGHWRDTGRALEAARSAPDATGSVSEASAIAASSTGAPPVASAEPAPHGAPVHRTAPSEHAAPDAQLARSAALAHQATLTKPVGSLGRLEELAAAYAAARRCFPAPRPLRATVALFAADHGVVVEGVSAYGSQLTAAIVANIMAGGAAVNALARELRVDLALVDVGIAGDLSALPTEPLVALDSRAVRRGTGNLRRGPAMTVGEALAAVDVGRSVARRAIDAGSDVLALGEVGIGNTTAAAALTCWCTGKAPSEVVGRGTGVGDEALARKLQVVTDALALHAPFLHSPIDALARLGGLELAALVGCTLEAAERQRPVMLDGFVTNAAALIALRLEPRVRGSLLASHRSPEPGARLALEHLALTPLLELGLRLGEGTGALLGVGLLRAAVAAQLDMASFATAGIVGRAGTGPRTTG